MIRDTRSSARITVRWASGTNDSGVGRDGEPKRPVGVAPRGGEADDDGGASKIAFTAFESFSLLADEKETGEEGEGEMPLAAAVPGAADRYARGEAAHCVAVEVVSGRTAEAAAVIVLLETEDDRL